MASYTPLPVVRNFVREFLQEQPPSSVMRQGKVDSVNSDGTLNITLGGSAIVIPNVRKLASYVASPGDTIWVAQTGPDLLALGTQGEGQGPQSLWTDTRTLAVDDSNWHVIAKGNGRAHGTFTIHTNTTAVHTFCKITAGAAFNGEHHIVVEELTAWGRSPYEFEIVGAGGQNDDYFLRFKAHHGSRSLTHHIAYHPSDWRTSDPNNDWVPVSSASSTSRLAYVPANFRQGFGQWREVPSSWFTNGWSRYTGAGGIWGEPRYAFFPGPIIRWEGLIQGPGGAAYAITPTDDNVMSTGLIFLCASSDGGVSRVDVRETGILPRTSNATTYLSLAQISYPLGHTVGVLR